MSDDLISRHNIVKKLEHRKKIFCRNRIKFFVLSGNDKARVDEIDCCIETVINMPPEQPQYTELTPEEAASEIASGSIMSASYWLDAMIRLKQMGYAICRKKDERLIYGELSKITKATADPERPQPESYYADGQG